MSDTDLPFRLAAVDLDETLLGPDKQISPENLRAVRRLQAAGVHILLASGRRHENMIRFHQKLGLEGWIVSCQGALSRHAETGTIIHLHGLSEEKAALVLAESARRNMTAVYYDIDRSYVCERNERTETYEERANFRLEDVADWRELAGRPPLKIVLIGEVEQVALCRPEINERFKERMETIVTESDYIEFLDWGVSKAEGVAAVAAEMGLQQREVLAFGDGNNDVGLLKWAGVGVAMDHAREAALAAADYISPEGDPESSFARGVEMLFHRFEYDVARQALV